MGREGATRTVNLHRSRARSDGYIQKLLLLATCKKEEKTKTTLNETTPPSFPSFLPSFCFFTSFLASFVPSFLPSNVPFFFSSFLPSLPSLLYWIPIS
jgi:hypothetical protein